MIALTASAFAEDREAAYDAGMDGFATKPITARGLLKAVNSCLKGRPMAKAAEDSGREETDRQLPALDRKLLDQMAEDLGPHYLAQALEVFFKDLEQRRQALRDLGDNADQLRKAAHAIKGSAASFGFVRVAHAAQALEQAARLGEHQHFEALKNDLLREAEVAPEHMNLA
jgi:HPt (histidine-containing phosphotransfer) domain-containing protein